MPKWQPKHEDILSILARYEKEKDAGQAIISIANELFCQKWDRLPLESLPQEIRIFLLVYYAEGEIGNGGIWAFFYNGLGKNVEATVDAFNNLGMKNKATALKRGMGCFLNGKYPKTIQEYNLIHDFVPENSPLNTGELDKLYYSEDTDVPLIKYVRKHLDNFLLRT
jgi:hypothetical protein